MGGRNPNKKHRAATPLVLFFDLMFVIAFGVAGSRLVHAVAEAQAGSSGDGTQRAAVSAYG